MNPVGCPDVVGAVELEQDEEGEEDAGNTKHVRRNQQVLGGETEAVVEVVDVDVHGQEDGSDDHDDVVAGQLFRDGVVESRGARGVGVELGEGMDEELGGGEEEVDGEEAVELPHHVDRAEYDGPPAPANLAEAQEGGEGVVAQPGRHHPVGLDLAHVQPEQGEDEVDEDADPDDGGQDDDEDHDVVAAHVLRHGEDDDGEEHEAAGHHGDGVEEAGEEVDDPLSGGGVVLVLDLEGGVLGSAE